MSIGPSFGVLKPALLLSIVGSAPAWGQTFDVAPGPLGIVVGRLGQQAGATITITGSELSRRRSPGVRGRFDLKTALARALAGTGARAVFYDPKLVRIVRREPMPGPRRERRAPPRPSPPPAEPGDEAEILVTGSKQRSALDRYPGTVKIVRLDHGWTARFGTDGVSALTRLLPTISSTNLGVGREKIFIRGVADSSFAGPTQAATGQYLGDVRLTYNAPDPALNLYDVERFEILVGPQAPLYGAGSLGGVVRLVPNVPDPMGVSGSGVVTASSTRHGAPGLQTAAMLNVPLVRDSVALRAVVSSDILGGYIDNPLLHRRDVNRSRLSGHRIALRAMDIAGWTADMGHVGQHVRTDTGQYVLNGADGLNRNEARPGPFRSAYDLGYFTASRPIGALRVVTTLAKVSHRLVAEADASALADIPLVNRQSNAISILSHETRVSGGTPHAPWVVGVSAIANRSRAVNRLSNSAGDALSVSIVNDNTDVAIYGQLTRPVTSTLSGTAGARVTYVRSTSYVQDIDTRGSAPPPRDAARFTRTIGLDWQPGGLLSGFLRHDQGYRPGGLNAAPTIVGLARRSYRPDTMDMYELGIRIGDLDRSRLAIRASVFHALWKDVQADQVDVDGLAFTENVGDGRISGLDLELRARLASFLITTSAFLNDTGLRRTDGQDAERPVQSLPNVADAGGRAAVDWSRRIDARWTLNTHGSIRYIGRSRLGVGSVLNIPQGSFAMVDAGIRAVNGNLSFSADVDNLTDTRGNSFAYGNPFTVARRDQRTPMRPRTVRISAGIAF